jgi:hypothetical protein
MSVHRRDAVPLSCTSALLAVLAACGGGNLGGMATGTAGAGGGGPIVTIIDAGLPTTMLAAGAANGPRDIAVDATHVYWNDAKANTVMKVPKGGGVQIALASDQIGVTGLAIDGTHVYWVNATRDAMGAVMKAPLGGGTPIAIASQQAAPNSIAVDATHVYWTTTGNEFSAQPPGSVWKVSLATGAIEMLVSGQPNVGSIAVDATAAYWTIVGDFYAGAILSLSLEPGSNSIRQLASAYSAASLVVVGGSVYWASKHEQPGSIARIARLTSQDAAPATLFSATSLSFSGLVLDRQTLYCGRSDRAIVRISADGSAVTIFPTEGQPIDLAVDDTHLYWTTAEGSVMAAAKP